MSFLKKLFGKKEHEKLNNEEIINNVEQKKIESENIEIQVNSEEKEVEKKELFSSLKEKLFKSREGLFKTIKNFFSGKSIIDDEMYEELEDILIQSDIGIEMSLKIIENLKNELKQRNIKNPTEIYVVLKEVLEGYLITEDVDLKIEDGKMNVILIVGVNGVGKTTTIGKITSQLVKEGKKVIIGAADTFRAAAVEQLEEWAKRSGAEIIKNNFETDPGAVVFDALKVGEEKKADVVIIDTAGRLHNKNNLMKELEKINNIIKKRVGNETYETLLVIDGTTGQNALVQARVFNEVSKLTGFIVTKMDGTAKGGIIFSISEELKKPIKYIGVGESIDDLRKFDAREYVNAIF